MNGIAAELPENPATHFRHASEIALHRRNGIVEHSPQRREPTEASGSDEILQVKEDWMVAVVKGLDDPPTSTLARFHHSTGFLRVRGEGLLT